MKRLLLILILTLSFQTLAKADGIKEFEIEGMSIGDSLLDFFSRDEIENNKTYEVEQKNNHSVARYYIRKNTNEYDFITISFKTNDKKYKIIEISGFLNLDFKKCKKKRNKINEELEPLFKKLRKQETGDVEHFLDKSTTVNHIAYWFKDDEYISLTCYDWSEKSGYDDQLRFEIYSVEYLKFLNTLS